MKADEDRVVDDPAPQAEHAAEHAREESEEYHAEEGFAGPLNITE